MEIKEIDGVKYIPLEVVAGNCDFCKHAGHPHICDDCVNMPMGTGKADHWLYRHIEDHSPSDYDYN